MQDPMIREEVSHQQSVNDSWGYLRARLLDEMGRGLTLTKLARRLVDYGLNDDYLRRNATPRHGLSPVPEESLRLWAEEGGGQTSLLRVRRHCDVPSQTEKIESALTLYFADLDEERSTARGFEPPRVNTSVMQKGLEAIHLARKACKPLHIKSVPGAGKSEFKMEYLSRARKMEGMDCPVWVIELGEWSISSKAILMLIAEKVCRKTLEALTRSGRNGPGEFELLRAIEQAAEGRDGVLIIDEANFLMDAPTDAGIRIINGLRRFCDKGLFGIVFLDNGELYSRLDPKGKRPQLTSRFDNWRVDIPAPNEDDIELVMHAWGVSGREERKLCLSLGQKAGTLRNLTDCFRSALEQYGEITQATMGAVLGSRVAQAGRGARS